jgi:hypothetical protein
MRVAAFARKPHGVASHDSSRGRLRRGRSLYSGLAIAVANIATADIFAA